MCVCLLVGVQCVRGMFSMHDVIWLLNSYVRPKCFGTYGIISCYVSCVCVFVGRGMLCAWCIGHACILLLDCLFVYVRPKLFADISSLHRRSNKTDMDV